jgi:hypothetical protein
MTKVMRATLVEIADCVLFGVLACFCWACSEAMFRYIGLPPHSTDYLEFFIASALGYWFGKLK